MDDAGLSPVQNQTSHKRTWLSTHLKTRKTSGAALLSCSKSELFGRLSRHSFADFPERGIKPTAHMTTTTPTWGRIDSADAFLSMSAAGAVVLSDSGPDSLTNFKFWGRRKSDVGATDEADEAGKNQFEGTSIAGSAAASAVVFRRNTKSKNRLVAYERLLREIENDLKRTTHDYHIKGFSRIRSHQPEYEAVNRTVR